MTQVAQCLLTHGSLSSRAEEQLAIRGRLGFAGHFDSRVCLILFAP